MSEALWTTDHKYRHLVGPQKDYDCVKNAIHNVALANMLEMRPKIMWVEFKSMNHAYFVDSPNVISKNITWMSNFYTELTIEEIVERKGKDITKTVFSQALGFVEDKYRYCTVISNLESHVPGVREKLLEIYK